MKKSIFIIIIIFQSVCFSQGLRFGITTSANINTITSKKYQYSVNGFPEAYKSEYSYNGGIEIIHNFNSKLALNTSILFISKVVSTDLLGPTDGLVKAKLHFFYLSFSPKLEYNPIFDIYLNAGPSIDLILRTRLDDYGDYGGSYNFIRGTNDLRAGLLFSIGYKIRFAKGLSIGPELSYDLGLTDTNSRLGGKYSSTRIGLVLFNH